MFYRKNVGPRERWGRLLAGGALAAFALFQHGLTPVAAIGVLGGAALALTGLVGFCPACALVGRRLRDPGR